MHNTDTWWNMLIKFSKQIVNNFAKIFYTKVISKHCHAADMEFFRRSILASEANSESFQISTMELFAKIVKNEKPFTIFAKTSNLDV